MEDAFRNSSVKSRRCLAARTRKSPRCSWKLNSTYPLSLLSLSALAADVVEKSDIEQVEKKIKRCTDVVGVFPYPATIFRLAGSVLGEQHDEWEAGDRRYFSEASMLELAIINNPIEPRDKAVILPELAVTWTEISDPLGVEKLHHSARREPTGFA